MATRNPKVDAYLAEAPAYAQPILAEVRKRIHAAVPGVDEEIKWRMPFFMFKGRALGAIAAFKKHTKLIVFENNGKVMGHARPTDVSSLEELPAAKAFAHKVKEAAAVILAHAQPAKAKTSAKTAAPKKARAKKKTTTRKNP